MLMSGHAHPVGNAAFMDIVSQSCAIAPPEPQFATPSQATALNPDPPTATDGRSTAGPLPKSSLEKPWRTRQVRAPCDCHPDCRPPRNISNPNTGESVLHTACHKPALGALQRRYNERTTKVLRRYYGGTTKVLLRHNGVTKVRQWKQPATGSPLPAQMACQRR